jgi:predicted O-methyltransferase YrrM
MKNYNEYINRLKDHLIKADESRFHAQQLLKLHEVASSKECPLIVELGVDRGQSTKIFLNAIYDKTEARLISLDIKDCSKVATSTKWEFVQQDSADINSLLINKPEIRKGIDILYVDSLHTSKHVKTEVYNFFEYLNENAFIFFDDIDSGPYMSNQRKDSAGTEINNRKIFKLLEAIFRANMSQLDFDIMRGSTGLGIFKKRSKLGEKLNEPFFLNDRNNHLFNKVINLISFKKTYKHDNKSLSSFLINPEKKDNN